MLKVKRSLNSLFHIDVIKYPNDELVRRIKLLEYHNIDVILDIGANIGQYGCLMRSLGYKGAIISFEPTQKAFETLQKNAKQSKNWSVYNYSLGDKNEKTYINISHNSVSSSMLDDLPLLTQAAPKAKFIEKEAIEVKTLDTIFESLNISGNNIYMKIDTQGYEEFVLKGATNSLNKIKGIQIEMSLIPSYKGTITFEKMKSNIEQLGFELLAIENGFFDHSTGKQLEVDGIFYKKDKL
ncbi:FkbM family methyltransferase [Flavobacterium branchiophilum NBRC 15030 = ATCC 35035]|uniref:FkbM family methyltransferase n=1 Tax=Flavobacterium branchiophilum TaxID=55197 RepID=UPI000839BA26|nr:FkbM family methyltransferase [Flavobacterium branchiophilum]OXA80910.1 FkbM family methyltransferase [Flavobacterium branchiophilum NBRC 15030 = ATCC 35035]